MWPLTSSYHGGSQTKLGPKRACGCKVIQVFVSVTDGGQTDGRNLDPLVSLHLGGLDKNEMKSTSFYISLYNNEITLQTSEISIRI